MNELPTRLERLPPLRVARVHALSATPELDAWRKLEAWASPRGLLGRCHPASGVQIQPPAAGAETRRLELRDLDRRRA